MSSDTTPLYPSIGMSDIVGEEQRYLTFVKKIARHEFRKNNFTRIITPIFERQDLFAKGLRIMPEDRREALYSIRHGREEYTLRPEITIPIMRAYLQYGMDEPQPVSYYYIEPIFRSDSTAPNGFIQSYHIGAEVIGEIDPVLDATMISLGASILDGIGIGGTHRLTVNFLGTTKEREKFIQSFVDFFADKKHYLSTEEKHLLETRPLALFHATGEDVRELVAVAPKVGDFLKKDSREYYEKVKEYLHLLGIEYTEAYSTVQQYDYYSHTVWEFETEDEEGNRLILGGGGRYDEVSKNIGYKESVPGVGFAFGVEKLVKEVMRRGIQIKNKDNIHLYIVQLGDEAKKAALTLTTDARKKGMNSLISLGTPSLKVQIKKASQIQARFVAIIGIMEARNGTCQLKDMELGTQEELPLSRLIDTVIERIGQDALDHYHPTKDFIVTGVSDMEE